MTARSVAQGFLCPVVFSAAKTAVILLTAKVYGFAPSPFHPNPLRAPRPNAMVAVLQGVMGDAGTPWFLYAVGAVFLSLAAFVYFGSKRETVKS